MMLLPDNLYHNDDTRDNVSRLFFGEMTKNITPFFQLSVEDMLCVSSRSPFFNFFQIVLNNKFLQQTKWFSEPLQYNYWLNRAVKTKTFVNTSDMIVAVKLRSTFARTENLQGLCAVVDEMFLRWGQRDIRPRWRFLCRQEVDYCVERRLSPVLH